MADEHIKRRTFVGETGTAAFDDYAGFRMNQSYQLRYTREFDEVRIALDTLLRRVLCTPLRWRSLISGL
jgi:hypothetical protein